MHWQASLLNTSASLARQVETDRAALPKDVASGNGKRSFWTVCGFTVVMLIGLSTCALPPLAPYASAKRSRLVPEFDADLVAFNPALPVLQPLRSHTSPVILRPAARVSMSDETPALEEDWREMRARLVARSKIGLTEEVDPEAVSKAAPKTNFVYETPLIEQGSVILGGTKQEFGFALRQQYFHKAVMLVLHHDNFFTKGIILNRISAFEIDGWRVWFGGDVAEGRMFQGRDAKTGNMEIVCLHTLSSANAKRLSVPIIKGVSYTTLEGAKAMVETGEAKQSNFSLFVGYAGWAPRQLQTELERDSWYLAAADSAVLIKELLRQGAELDGDGEGKNKSAVAGDGLKTWETLMERIGKEDEVERTRGSLEDRMLTEWVKFHLLPQETPAVDTPALPQGSASLPGVILRSVARTSKFALDKQFLHKSFVLLIDELPRTPQLTENLCLGVILNRPIAAGVQLNLKDTAPRHVSFGGDSSLQEGILGVDSDGLLWLYRPPKLGERLRDSVALGDTGIYRVNEEAAIEALKDGKASVNDFLFVAGIMVWQRSELEELIAAGEFEVANKEVEPLLKQVWALSEMPANAPKFEIRDGTGLWWASRVQWTAEGAMQVLPSAQLGDECLKEWFKFFGGYGVDWDE